MSYLLLAFVLAELFLFVDLLQTRYISKHPEKFYEINILLGNHPSIFAVNTYFILWFIGVGVLYYFGLVYILAAVAVMELYVTARNYKLGVGIA